MVPRISLALPVSDGAEVSLEEGLNRTIEAFISTLSLSSAGLG